MPRGTSSARTSSARCAPSGSWRAWGASTAHARSCGRRAKLHLTLADGSSPICFAEAEAADLPLAVLAAWQGLKCALREHLSVEVDSVEVGGKTYVWSEAAKQYVPAPEVQGNGKGELSCEERIEAAIAMVNHEADCATYAGAACGCGAEVFIRTLRGR